MGIRFGAALTAAILSLGACAARADVHIAQGDLAGVTAGGARVFPRIPFAAPPVGDLRWRPPEPPANWTGVRKADAFGPICLQAARGFFGGSPMSEDCLTLNVWRPAGAKPGEKIPVMVWIYGGAFVQGSSAAPFYDGIPLREGCCRRHPRQPQLPPRPLWLLRSPGAGRQRRAVRQLRPDGPDRRPRLGEGQHRKLRRRSAQRHGLWRERRGDLGQRRFDGFAGCEGPLRQGDRRGPVSVAPSRATLTGAAVCRGDRNRLRGEAHGVKGRRRLGRRGGAACAPR